MSTATAHSNYHAAKTEFAHVYANGYRYSVSVEQRDGELMQCNFAGETGQDYARQFALNNIRKGARSAIVYELTETGRRVYCQSYDWRDIK